METLKLLLKEPALIEFVIVALILIIGKIDKSNTISGLIIKLGKALETKK